MDMVGRYSSFRIPTGKTPQTASFLRFFYLFSFIRLARDGGQLPVDHPLDVSAQCGEPDFFILVTQQGKQFHRVSLLLTIQ